MGWCCLGQSVSQPVSQLFGKSIYKARDNTKANHVAPPLKCVTAFAGNRQELKRPYSIVSQTCEPELADPLKTVPRARITTV